MLLTAQLQMYYCCYYILHDCCAHDCGRDCDCKCLSARAVLFLTLLQIKQQLHGHEYVQYDREYGYVHEHDYVRVRGYVSSYGLHEDRNAKCW